MKKPAFGKVMRRIARVLSRGGFIKIEVGAKVTHGGRGLSAHAQRTLHYKSGKKVLELTERQVENAMRLELITHRDFWNAPRRNCFDLSTRSGKIFGRKGLQAA